MKDMPFKILAMASFQMTGEIPWKKAPIAIDRMAIHAAIEEMGVSAYIPLPGQLCPAGGLDLHFKKLKDFHPDGLIQNTPFLSHLLEARHFLTDALTKKFSEQQIREGLNQWPDLPELEIPVASKKSQETQSAKSQSSASQTTAIDNILDMVALPGETPDSSPVTPPDIEPAGADQIDGIVQKILSCIFEDENFRASEAAWQGLKLVLPQAGTSDESNVLLEIVPITMGSLEETLNNMTARLIDNLPSLIIIDHAFDNSPHSISLLEKIADFSETLMVPAVVQAGPEFFQLDSWSDIKKLSFIPHHLEQAAYAKWQTLKSQPSANWVAVSCNRFLTRYPYGTNNLPRKCNFTENQLPWIGSVWGIAALIVQSFIAIGWPTRFTDWQNIRIENLALHTDNTPGEIPTEIVFDTDRLDQFARAGIMSLAAASNKDIAFLPKQTTMTGISFAYQLFVSRITQFILLCKESVPDDLSAQDLAAKLKQAFSQFWEKSGHSGPEFLDITAGTPDADGRIPLHIELQPSRKILPKGESMVMDFFW